MASKRKQQEIVGRLVTSALAHLSETSLPYVLILLDNILSNCPEQHARMIIQDAYQLQEKIREVKVERQVDSQLGFGGDDSDAKAD